MHPEVAHTCNLIPVFSTPFLIITQVEGAMSLDKSGSCTWRRRKLVEAPADPRLWEVAAEEMNSVPSCRHGYMYRSSSEKHLMISVDRPASGDS